MTSPKLTPSAASGYLGNGKPRRSPPHDNNRGADISRPERVPFRKAASGPTASRGRSVEARAAARGHTLGFDLALPLALYQQCSLTFSKTSWELINYPCRSRDCQLACYIL